MDYANLTVQQKGTTLMFDWLKNEVTCTGSVLFRGTLPPRAEEFGELSNYGISIRIQPSPRNVHWMMKLSHPQWGEAKLAAFRDLEPPRMMIEQDFRLTDEERTSILTAGTCLWFSLDGKKQHVLKDRKNALRFMNAIMGDSGIAAIDLVSQSTWSRETLEDELAHDADLDVTGIYTMHAVTADDRFTSPECYDGQEFVWLHSHGLAEIGFFDFDIINPSTDLFTNKADILRSIAFGIVEEQLSPARSRFSLSTPKHPMRLVKANVFQKHALPEHRELRYGAEEGHNNNRSVLCEPGKGFFRRWSKQLEPANLLSGEIGDNIMFHFSTSATELMAERARKTYFVFRDLADEFEKTPFPKLVKIGILTDTGDYSNREHMWFEVDKCYEDHVEATLISSPFYVSTLKEGDRGKYSIEDLTDWSIMTLWGTINPRTSVIARKLRQRSDLLEQFHRMPIEE